MPDNAKRVNRPFKVIAFDWDGTAVADRGADTTALRSHVESLLKLDVKIVIITGTSFANVDRRFSAAIFGAHKRQLYVCTNRGSEVYGFDPQSHPQLLSRRVANAAEDRLLDEIAARVRARVEDGHVKVAVVSQRLNRRKIDLIPLPEWHDPPKAQIAALLRAVNQRLREGGFPGGLGDVLRLVVDTSRDAGLPEARITSDVKHVEVGLTDKGDSVTWLMRELVAKSGLAPRDVLLAGDEFGPIDGFPGSDYVMSRAAGNEAMLVSVGVEPLGVPANVLHLPGGPARFLALLGEQIALLKSRPPGARRSPNSPDGWVLVERGFNLAREHEVESIFSVGNGYLGTRGSLAEGTAGSRPATFVAGVFTKGDDAGVPELLKAPDWTLLRVFVAGKELRLDQGEILAHRRVLDLRRGTLHREWRHRDDHGRITRLHFRRFASLADRHTLAESLTLVAENYDGPITVESTIAGATDDGASADYIVPASTAHGHVLALRVAGDGHVVAFAMSTKLRPVENVAAKQSAWRSDRSLHERWVWAARRGEQYQLEKLVAVFTSRDGVEPISWAAEHVAMLGNEGFAAVRTAHEKAWAERWRQSDVAIEGNADDQRAMRFAIYHLISAVNAADPRVSIGARDLSGEAYRGHVFWDTETFMLPFYTFTDPASARTLLAYRYHTLPAAVARAERMGYRGALYAWESTTSGEDVTPGLVVTADGQVIRILSGEMEHHISADIAYAVWQYWQAARDDRFLVEAGAEILLETARFWASRGQRGSDGLFHIRRVIGPDEYHEGVDDNAYTNVMAQWNLEQAAAVVTRLRQHWPRQWAALADRIGLRPDEPDEWLHIARIMYTGFDAATGLFEQFAGYFDLEYVDLAAFEPRTAPLDVILGRERTEKTQIIKQADVILLLHLLWDRFPAPVREANFRYYEPRCDHGSSLSPAIHSLVAARLGDVGLAERYFRQTAAIDLANNMGNSALGVHMAAQGGLWQAVSFGFAGMSPAEDGPHFAPHLASAWHSLALRCHWRGRRLRFRADRSSGGQDASLQKVVPRRRGKPKGLDLDQAAQRLIDEEVAS